MPSRELALDAMGRTPLADASRVVLVDAFSRIRPGKRSALVVLFVPGSATMHAAANINGTWKVAGGVGVAWQGKRPAGWTYAASIEGSW